MTADRFICKGCGGEFLFARELIAHVLAHRAECDGTDCQHGAAS